MTRLTVDQFETGRMANTLKEWVIVVLTFAFVLLYAVALVGKLKPLADLSIVSRLEPIIFVVIGYYFGRLPGQQNELTLKNEIGRLAQKAEAAQQARETELRSREALDEKLRNAKTALESGGLVDEGNAKVSNQAAPPSLLHSSIAAAFKILKS